MKSGVHFGFNQDMPQGEILMKNTFWTAIIVLFGFCNVEAGIVDRIYAQVNDDIITLSDVNRRREAIRRELATRMKGKPLEEAVRAAEGSILDGLIEEKLLIQKAIELGVDADVEPSVSSQIQQIMKDNNIDNMDDFERALEEQGTTLQTFRDQVRDQIMQNTIIDYFVRSRITLMKSDIEKYYKNHATDFATPEEISLSEITITAGAEGSDAAAESRARALYNRLKKGESFAELASQYSRGATASKGGSIGSNLLEKWHPDIVKAIAGLESGDITEPQKTPEGYVIYRVDLRKHSTIPPIEEIESQIKQRIYEDRFEPELERYVNRLKEEAYIQIYSEEGE